MTSKQSAKPILLVFGPLALSIDAHAVAKVRECAASAGKGWLLDAVSNLPADYITATSQLPALKPNSARDLASDAGLSQLRLLSLFIKNGQPLVTESSLLSFPLPNKILIPLAVVAQLTQYAEFVDRTYTGYAPGSPDSQFRTYAAAAIRLGMVIGCVLDTADSESDSEFGAISTTWNMDDVEAIEKVKRTLKDYPDIYVSNYHDYNRVTVTGPLSLLLSLKQRLKSESGIACVDVKGLRGSFHSRRHAGIVESLIQFCEEHPEFQLPDASACHLATRGNRDGGRIIEKGSLHRHALGSILVDAMEWHAAFDRARRDFIRDTVVPDGQIVVFGHERPIPPSMLQGLGSRIRYDYMAITNAKRERNDDIVGRSDAGNHPTVSPVATQALPGPPTNDIAIVGMSIKVAGANDLESFWDVLCSGKSQHREVPKERFSFGESIFRDAGDPSRKWFANLIDDPADFDHHFFKKSPRESAAMDPQQRHMLQIAYQAVEMSGYFRPGGAGATWPDDKKRRVGCFVGCSTCDYEQNVACHNASAFSATSQLRAFVAGKVSHFFGWTGPAVTIDTACSSSAVAVHQACQAILAGDCDAALAGGSFVMAGPQWFEDLSAAAFLSPTGQCKPFDAAADGYCRGDGVAAVFLKRLDDAVADGDDVLGVIGATRVQQNENSTSIFVPNKPSLSNLFETVLAKAGLQPGDVSVVEAHGTGTAVGDPAEYSAVRQVLGGINRTRRKVTRSFGTSDDDNPLYLGSVKGSVGHTECTAGVVSLIKVVLMLNKGMIPPQASFNKINMSLHATPDDHITINTGFPKPWDARFKAALVSSYGASGSNACILVKQKPMLYTKATTTTKIAEFGENLPSTRSGLQYPFWLSANDDQSLRRYARVLRQFISRRGSGDHVSNQFSVGDISASLSRQNNRLLGRSLFMKASSLDDLQRMLSGYENGSQSSPGLDSVTRPASKPVIFCFGGQISRSIGLDATIFEAVPLLRKHLVEVDVISRSHIPEGIIHTILDKSPQDDPVKLQVALFALQYASARSWMDSGIEPVAVVGHSFGEISAMGVGGVLSLGDAVKLVVRRATLVRDAWGADKGAMLAVEADLGDVQDLVAATGGGGGATIACYNGPRSFTLGGSTAAIDQIEGNIASAAAAAGRPIKAKRLDVSNAFHSPLVDPLVQGLDQCGRGLEFCKPAIHVERCTEMSSLELPGPRFVSRHMREPVYFYQAIKRLAARYQTSGAIFLESGSNSTITKMASRALGEVSSRFSFQAINITNITASSTGTATAYGSPVVESRCWGNLVDATVNLWASGAVNLQFWAHHLSQPRSVRAPLLLPPYQFEPARHWLDRIRPSQIRDTLPKSLEENNSDKSNDGISANGMIAFAALIGSGKVPVISLGREEPLPSGSTQKVLFRVVTESPRYRRLVDGHRMARTAGICPATVQVDLVIEALCMTLPGRTRRSNQQGVVQDGSGLLLSSSGLQPQVSDVVCHVPLTCNPDRMVWVEIPPASYNCPLLSSAATPEQSIQGDISGHTATQNDGVTTEFVFEVFSTDLVMEQDWAAMSNNSTFAKRTRHTTGKIKLAHQDDPKIAKEFGQFSRLINNTQVTQLLHGADADNSLSHKSVYLMFENIVQYCDEFCGIQRLVSRENQTAAIVNRPPPPSRAQNGLRPHRAVLEQGDGSQGDGGELDDAGSWFQPCVADTFAQTAGMWLNCLATDLQQPDQLFVFNGFDRWIRAPPPELQANYGTSPEFAKMPARPTEMHVLARQHRTSEKTAVSDVFVFDAATGRLTEAVLGVGWSKVPRSHMQQTLARLAGSGVKLECKTTVQQIPADLPVAGRNISYPLSRSSDAFYFPEGEGQPAEILNRDRSPHPTAATSLDIHSMVRELLAELSGLSISDVADNCELVDLGLDSLMNMELASEIRSTFKVTITERELMHVVHVSDLVECVGKLVGSTGTTLTTAATTPDSEILLQSESSDEQSLSSHSSWRPSTASTSSYGDENSNLSLAEDGKEPWLKGVTQSPEQLAERKSAVDGYVRMLTQDWAQSLEKIPKTLPFSGRGARGYAQVVAVTGGTGGLGAHLVARLARDPGVARVVCLNRPNKRYHDPTARQVEAVLSKTGLDLSQPQQAGAASKLRVLETDLSQPLLGLDPAEYWGLAGEVTHIVHNGWKMSLAHGVEHFEPQLWVMRRLLDLARDAALSVQLPSGGVDTLASSSSSSPSTREITFQFVSSIAVVGQHPLVHKAPHVPEERVGIESVLPAGYADAKWACERMLDETLHRWPGLFRAMAVRLGQIGASRSGYWNTAEHLSFLIKSSQTLGLLPDLGGTLAWTPVDDIAGSLADLVLVGVGKDVEEPCYPIYHIDNPMRTPWREMMTVLADELGLDLHKHAIPFDEWVQRVTKHGPGAFNTTFGAENPAFLLIDFLEANFERVSCGGLLMDTCHTQEHSPTMRGVEPFSHDLTRLFIQKWRDSGFLV
uniref:Polyketide synthase 12 n=1 Tax=Diaporthe helianthi TaxID=158607 RepID=A0A1I9KHW7_DIAHE|nr:polyketide synthase 12 [Diaporthe helianthi]